MRASMLSGTVAAEPAVCPCCHAVYRGGRWQWLPVPAEASACTCPACARIADQRPGGEVAIATALSPAQQLAITQLAQQIEAAARAEHPLERLIAIDGAGGMLRITTTDPQLARRIGAALEQDWGGLAHYAPDPEAAMLRVRWQF